MELIASKRLYFDKGLKTVVVFLKYYFGNVLGIATLRAFSSYVEYSYGGVLKKQLGAEFDECILAMIYTLCKELYENFYNNNAAIKMYLFEVSSSFSVSNYFPIVS